MDNIKELLERYFEGLTSVEEEAMLRRFFACGDVPENLKMYKPLFAYFSDEISTLKVKNDTTSRTSKIDREIHLELENKPVQQSNKKFVLWLIGAAASAAILVGVFFTNQQSKKCPTEGNYVIINGRCYTDEKTIRSATLNTFREISEDDSDFTKEESSGGVKRIIDNQLNEFGSLFDE